MFRELYRRAIFADTSAIVALFDSSEPLHADVYKYWDLHQHLEWFSLNITSHELFTRTLYKNNHLDEAIKRYNFLRSKPFSVLTFDHQDEDEALGMLKKYSDKKLSFHDALCAAVMKRTGIGKVYTIDSDFYTFGFEVFPGPTTKK